MGASVCYVRDGDSFLTTVFLVLLGIGLIGLVVLGLLGFLFRIPHSVDLIFSSGLYNSGSLASLLLALHAAKHRYSLKYRAINWHERHMSLKYMFHLESTMIQQRRQETMHAE